MVSSSDSDDSLDEYLSVNRDPFKRKHDSDDDLDREQAFMNIASSDDDDEEDVDLFQDKYSISLQKDDMASDIEDDEEEDADGGEGGEEKYLPDSKAWGSEKSAYYSTDYVDRGKKKVKYLEEDENQAEYEEEEAMSIQKRMMKEMKDADLGLDWINQDHDNQSSDSDEDNQKATQVFKIDVSKLSQKERSEMIKKRCPELLSLDKDFKKYQKELSLVFDPIVDFAEKTGTESASRLKKTSGFKLMKVKYLLMTQYLKTVSHYIKLKTTSGPDDLLNQGVDANQGKRKSLDTIMKQLVQFKRMLSEVDQMFESREDFESDIRMLLEKIKSGDEILFEDEADVYESDEEDFLSDSKGQMIAEDDEEEEETGSDRRRITYEMEKNKGLTAQKKKRLRTPRVKHREKFKKAKVRRKGQVREARKEVNKYGGEFSGIKSNLVRSIKFHHWWSFVTEKRSV